MYQYDPLRVARNQHLRSARPAGIAQGRLSFDQDDIGIRLRRAAENGVFQFAGDEIVERGIEDESIFPALEPAGLAGVDHVGAHAGFVAGVHQQAGGRALAECAIGSQDRDHRRAQMQDFPGPEMQIFPRLGFADIEQLHAVLRGEIHDIRPLG